MKRTIFGLLVTMAFAAVPAAAADDGTWTPDAALIAKIEAAIPPVMANGLTDLGNHPATAPDTLDHYARFYAGATDKGEKVVVVAAILGMGEAPGVHVVTLQELPDVSDGGCGVIHFWYHVASGKPENVCNFAL